MNRIDYISSESITRYLLVSQDRLGGKEDLLLDNISWALAVKSAIHFIHLN